MASTNAQIAEFENWLLKKKGLQFSSYEELWSWSAHNVADFWESVWKYFDMESPTPYRTVLENQEMLKAKWFPGAQANYVQRMFKYANENHEAGHPAIVFQNENMDSPQETSWPELERQVGAFATYLRSLGVKPGDRVCALVSNTPQAITAFLGCASIGAIWSACSIEMGAAGVLDRFRQIEPTVLIAANGYTFAGEKIDRTDTVIQILESLPTVKSFILLSQLGTPDLSSFRIERKNLDYHHFEQAIAAKSSTKPLWLPFEHPMWIVFSSGTTGLPKPIVHSHGGVMIEALKFGAFHNNLQPSFRASDRYHWYSNPNWIIWNLQICVLMCGTTICIYDGSPNGRKEKVDWGTLWKFAAKTKATYFGAGAAFYGACEKMGLIPGDVADLSSIKTIGSTGSPLAENSYDWIWSNLPKVNGKNIWIHNFAGGTDFAGCFWGGLPTIPLVKGEMQVRCLGAAVYAYGEPDSNGVGKPLTEEVGELVCTEPMPSMPLYFWNDPSGSRYFESYFSIYRHADGRPIWRHGDWLKITKTGSGIIFGRSDTTINRSGIRMGTGELYRAVESAAEVLDSLVIDFEYLGRESYMPLFVVLKPGLTLDDALKNKLKDLIKKNLTPKHVPSEILQVPAVPRTLSGKKMELPIKKILMGEAPAKVLNRDAMSNPSSVAWFEDFAKQRDLGART
ncbi:MAG: acetoacetate--CoA ligase [Bdellovibrionales bacterium]|nr:acetoacetate--CoA ligase [Bdellovibrionales bacterium]